jgi:FYVE, RhoGEF and PH domain containing 5/6
MRLNFYAVTNSLNTSLQNHAQSLSLVSLQRSTSNLPFQLVVPGQTLLKRGPLCQIERSEPARDREFLLFSDCMVWLSRSGDETEWMWGKMMIGSSFGNLNSSSSAVESLNATSRIYGHGDRNRSMSDAHLPLSSTIRRSGGVVVG